MLSRFNFKWEAEPAAKETDETDSKSKEKPKKKKSRLEKALNEKLSELLQFLSMKLYLFLITIFRKAMQVSIVYICTYILCTSCIFNSKGGSLIKLESQHESTEFTPLSLT